VAAERAILSEARHAAVSKKTLPEAVAACSQDRATAVGSRWDNPATKQEMEESAGRQLGVHSGPLEGQNRHSSRRLGTMSKTLQRSVNPFVLSAIVVSSILPLCSAQQEQVRPHRMRENGRVTAAHLRAVPPRYNGPCPGRLRFPGTITTNGPAEVRYTWVSFDGGTWPERTLRFTAAGTKQVGENWQLGAAGQVTHGWLQLRILSPNHLQSPRAAFQVACGERRPHPGVRSRPQ